MRPPAPANQRAALAAARARGTGPYAARARAAQKEEGEEPSLTGAAAQAARRAAEAQAQPPAPVKPAQKKRVVSDAARGRRNATRSAARKLSPEEKARRLDERNAARKRTPEFMFAPPVRPWTPEEDEVLRELQRRVGTTPYDRDRECRYKYEWKHVVEEMEARGYPKRWPLSARTRFGRLKKQDTALYKNEPVQRPPSYYDRRKPGEPDRRLSAPFVAAEDRELLRLGKCVGETRPLCGTKYTWAVVAGDLACRGFPKRSIKTLRTRYNDVLA